MDLQKIQKNCGGMLFGFAIPCIIGMLLTAAISIVDGYFVGQFVGKNGTAAVNLGLPLVYVYLGLGMMAGVGGIAVAGMADGAGEIKKCNSMFRQSIALTALITGGLTVVLAALFYPVTAQLPMVAGVRECFQNYYFIMLFVYPIMVVNSNLGIFMRGEGKPQVSMFISILGLVFNVIFDYAAVKVLGLGMQGVAYASLLSVGICFLISVLFFAKGAKVYHFGKFSFEKEAVKQILFNGSSEMIGELSMCITMAVYNVVILRNAGVDGVAAFAIVGYAAYAFSMVIIGIGQGMSPLVSFVYGAGDEGTAKRLLKRANLMCLIAGILVFAGMLFGKQGYSEMFLDGADAKEVGALIRSGITIFSVSFLLEGFNTMASFYFTSIGRAKESALISSARGLVVLLAMILLLPVLFGMTGVWLAAPVTEGLTILISAACLWRWKGIHVRIAVSQSGEAI